MPSAPRDLSRSGTLYSVLGVSADATPEEVRRAYRLLAHRLHPDRRRGDEKLRPGAAAAEFSIVSEAYEVLSDEGRRDIYDAIGMDGLRLGLIGRERVDVRDAGDARRPVVGVGGADHCARWLPLVGDVATSRSRRKVLKRNEFRNSPQAQACPRQDILEKIKFQG